MSLRLASVVLMAAWMVRAFAFHRPESPLGCEYNAIQRALWDEETTRQNIGAATARGETPEHGETREPDEVRDMTEDEERQAMEPVRRVGIPRVKIQRLGPAVEDVYYEFGELPAWIWAP